MVLLGPSSAMSSQSSQRFAVVSSISGGHFHKKKQLFEEAFHFVMTYEQKEDKLPVLTFSTEQVHPLCSTVK